MIEAAPAAGEAPHGPPGTLPDEPPKSGPHDLAPQDAGPIDIRQIMAMLPHRYPMLLVDRVESLIPGKSIRAVKAVTINEHFFVGHFPGRPIMPGVMIIEALAQAAGILALKSLGYDRGGKLVYFMGIDEAKFRVPVEPGVLLTLDVEFVQKRPTASKFFGRALIGERIAAQASFTAMIADSPED